MTLNESKKLNRTAALLLAVVLNAAFLLFILGGFELRFETNDDLLMSKFVDGQLSHKSAHVPFINIALGALFKLLYTLGGDGIPWWSICEYAAAFLGFTAVTWIFLRRFRPLPALTITTVILCVFALDTYLSMNFSKASAAASVGGMALMLHAMRNDEERVLKLPLVLGFLLSVYGFMWRFEEFFACAAIIAGLGVYALIEIGQEKRGASLREKLIPMLRYAAPFVLLLVFVVALFGVNHLAWTNSEYKDYYTFDWTRSELIDSVVPEYSQMPEVYDSLDMDENAIKLFKGWSFYDTEKFTTESLRAVIDARSEFVHFPGLGECLSKFIEECIPGFYQERPLPGLLFMLVLFFACGRRGLKEWVTALWLAGVFAGMYFVFIYFDRYLVNRIDIGLFFALAVGFAWLLDTERLKGEKLLCAVVIAAVLFVGYRSARSVCRFDSHNTIEDKSDEKAAVETILDDEEHLYFVKYLSIDHELYAPFELPPQGYADKIVFIGGWSCRHPEIVRVLDAWGITNPYRDIIGSESIRIIDNDIETTMAYINKYYAPSAAAERVEPLSTQTGLNIYRILD